MKNHIITNTLRTIKKSTGRFISLIIMSLLGVIVFTGLQATSPDMINTIDTYFDEYNTYDIKILSTMGLTNNDIESLSNLEGIKDLEGNKSVDVLIKNDEEEIVLNIASLPKNINTLNLIEGRFPSSDNEIVVEENFIKKLDYNLNDIIIVENENLNEQEFTIVGIVRSTLYFTNTKINQTRGSSNLGSGNINYYTYVLEESFNTDYYTNIYITINQAKEKITSSKSYLNIIEESKKNIEEIKTNQEEIRYEEIYNKSKKEIEDEEKKINDELSSFKKELDKAKKELDKAKKTLDTTKKELDNAKAELNKAKKEIDNGKNNLNQALQDNNISNISESLITVNYTISDLQTNLNNLDKESIEYQTLSNKLTVLEQKRNDLNNLKTQEELLTSSEKKYNENNTIYNNSYTKYQNGLKSYNSNLKKYNTNYKEYLSNKKEAEEKISEAYTELEKIDHPKWYIEDREDHSTYSSYINQAKSIKNLASLFPVVFYGVAILVSLVSMNRMVEDDRSEIGTLKSLGFSNSNIRLKYIIFSLTATLLGSIIGTSIGLYAIPYLIFSIYRLLFDVPMFKIGLNLFYTLEGIIIAIICICGASILTANKILKDKPAVLMRPAAPKNGKKVFLEKIKFIWNRLNFSKKITVRNLFRYKKRVIVTILGIASCTALMLCGFGIKDSIVDITKMQYVKTFTYDISAYTNDIDTEEISSFIESLPITSYTTGYNISGTLKDSSINIIVLENKESLSNIAYLENKKGDEIHLEDDDCIITDKVAKIYNLKENDTITVLDNDKNEYNLTITKIAKNYMGHYIYISADTLNKIGYEYKTNVIYMNTEELNSQKQDEMSKTLLDNEHIIYVVHKNTLIDSVEDMLNSLNKVIIVLVSLSACLSFVVLYNLSNINIRERKREIATLKVLGFYDSEVDNYINKETIILTIFGISLGLFLGSILTNAVISTVEMENAHFIRHIKLNSYIYSSIISALFTIIVNFVTHFTLKKINMIESLKSVE